MGGGAGWLGTRFSLLLAFGLFAAGLCGAESAPDATADADVLRLAARARQGEVQAQLELGFRYYQGLSGRAADPVRAAYWFGCAARQGSAEAQYNFGRCHWDGFGVRRSPRLAFEWFQKAAGQGLKAARLALADLYFSGIPADPDATPPEPEIPRNLAAAVALLDELADAGDPVAQRKLALYELGSAPDAPDRGRRIARAINYLKSAAAAGDTLAQLRLADCFLENAGVPRDEKQAFELLEKAAASGLPEALAKLAFACENGFGAPPDPQRALGLYRQALEQDFSPLAAVRLGNYYLTGRSGCRQDISEAIKLYRQAAEAGVPEAMYHLGECYAGGIGVVADPRRAFEFFFQAAKADYPAAQYATGRCFGEGMGTPRDEQAAFYWFNQAAIRNDPRALLEAGRRYLNGSGVQADTEKAMVFLELALANGMNDAAALLERARERRLAAPPEAEKLPGFQLRNR